MPEDINLIQKEVLTKDIDSNSYFKHSPIPSKNFELQTEKKNMVHAINEIKKDTEISVSSLDKKVEDNNTKVDNVYKNVNKINEEVTEIKGKLVDSDSGSVIKKTGCNYVECIYDYEIKEEEIGQVWNNKKQGIYAKYTLKGYDESMGYPKRIIIFKEMEKDIYVGTYINEYEFKSNPDKKQIGIILEPILDVSNGELGICKFINKDGSVEYFINNINNIIFKPDSNNNGKFEYYKEKFLTRYSMPCNNIEYSRSCAYMTSDFVPSKTDFKSSVCKYIVRLFF